MQPSSNGFPGRPTQIKAPHGARLLEIGWPGGTRDAVPHEILRGFCPCAGCQGHSGNISFQPGRNLEIRDLQTVGRYALSFSWGDGHDSGIYTFEYIWRLARLIDEHGKEGLVALGTLPAPGTPANSDT